MRWTKAAEHEAAQFIQVHYVMWVVGMMEPDLAAEMNELTPPGRENWIQVMDRECSWTRQDLQARFTSLCETMSDEEALDAILQEAAT